MIRNVSSKDEMVGTALAAAEEHWPMQEQSGWVEWVGVGLEWLA